MNNFKQKFADAKTAKKIVWIIFLIIAILILVYTSYQLIKIFTPPKNPLADYHEKPNGAVSEVPPKNPVDFAALKERNPDVCAWIYVPGSGDAYGTTIDYPILQSGEDKVEDFYLKHDIDNKPLFDGSIYIQKANQMDFSDPNTIIYGHDLYNKTMFTPLRKYRNRKFFDEHPYIYIYTPGHILKYHIFSTTLYNDNHLLYSYDFSNKEDYQKFLDETMDTSKKALLVRDGVTVTPNDKMITLSTCTNNEHERLLLIAVLIEDTQTQ